MSQQRELRRAAAEAFIESLDHLQQTLEPVEELSPQVAAEPPRKIPQSDPQPFAGFDLEALEDAIADIEQFIQHRSNG